MGAVIISNIRFPQSPHAPMDDGSAGHAATGIPGMWSRRPAMQGIQDIRAS